MKSNNHLKPPVVVQRHQVKGDTPVTTNAAALIISFPHCDAAVQKMKGGGWDLADAIVEECCETGEDGVKNESYAKMNAMRVEIAKNHGIELSLERIRKLRKVASAFPAGRRRPGLSLEAHLEAGTPDALDEFVKAAPKGTALTRAYIRQSKDPAEQGERTVSSDTGPLGADGQSLLGTLKIMWTREGVLRRRKWELSAERDRRCFVRDVLLPERAS
jgi:hypothetical protein